MIRQWRRLRDWSDAEFESAELYRCLEDSARRWRTGRAPLLQTPELELDRDWRGRTAPTAAWARRYGTRPDGDGGDGFWLAMDYLDESLKAATEQRRKAEEEQRAKLAQARWRTACALAGLVLRLAGWAALERVRADGEREHAAGLERRAIEDLFGSKLARAALLARLDDYAGAHEELDATVGYDAKVPQPRRQARNLLAGYVDMRGDVPQSTYRAPLGTRIWSLALSPDERSIAAGTHDGRVLLIDRESGKVRRTLVLPPQRDKEGNDVWQTVMRLFWDPQGRWLLGAIDGSQRIFKWSASTGEVLTSWIGSPRQRRECGPQPGPQHSGRAHRTARST